MTALFEIADVPLRDELRLLWDNKHPASMMYFYDVPEYRTVLEDFQSKHWIVVQECESFSLIWLTQTGQAILEDTNVDD